MGHFPHGGVGAKLVDHVGQISKEEKFRGYDHNHLDEDRKKWNNVIYHGGDKPKNIDFSDIANSTTPISMISTSEDKWSAQEDSEWVYRQMMEWRNYTSGYYQPSPHAPREYKMIPGSHFTTYIGKDMSWTDDVISFLDKSLVR